MAGEALRKAKRRARTACMVRKVSFNKFLWYDWVCFVIAVLFLVYGIVTVIVTGVKLSDIENNGRPEASKVKFIDEGAVDKKTREPSIEQDIYQSVDIKPGRNLCCFQIVTEVILILVMLLIIAWLRYLRNMCVFLFVIIFMVILVCLFIAIGSSACSNRWTMDEYHANVLNHITKHLIAGDMYYLLKLYDLQFTFQCCGINNYSDWRTWSGMLPSLKNYSLPNSCCTDKTAGMQALANPCNNEEILKESPKSKAFKGIHKDGCGKTFQNKYNAFFLGFIIHAFIIAVLLIFFILLLLFLGNRLYQKMMSRNWDRDDGPREQEDDLESDLIPGTPAKSMMSDDENTFYAP